MAKHPQVDALTAIYELLNQDTTLSGLVNGVYDNVPDNTDPPFVVIGRNDSWEDFSSHTFDGFNADIQISSWAEGRGSKTVRQIMNRIYEILHNKSLVFGYSQLSFRCTTSEVVIESDGRTYQGVQVFNLLTGGR